MTNVYIRTSTPSHHPNPPLLAERGGRWFQVNGFGQTVREIGVQDVRYLDRVTSPFTVARMIRKIDNYLEK